MAQVIETTQAYGLTFSYPAGDEAIGHCLMRHGEFSRMGVSFAIKMTDGGAFVDVGANIGVFTLPVARTAASVVAIEAHPGLAELLRTNVEQNGLSNVQVIHAAAGALEGLAEFPAPPLSQPMNFGTLGVGQVDGPTATVSVVRLDDVAPATTAAVKIDVEGFELEVLKGARRLLLEVRPCWIIELNDMHIVTELREARYRTYWFYDAFVTPRAPKEPWDGAFRGDLSVLCVPEEKPQPGGMVEAFPGEPRPATCAGFEYLGAFGFPPSTFGR